MLLTAALLLCSRLSWRILLKGLKPLLFILLFTALINLFATQGHTVLWQWWIIRITREGLVNAVFMLCRLLSLFLGSSVILTYTTSPLDLTDGIEPAAVAAAALACAGTRLCDDDDHCTALHSHAD